MLKDKIFSVSEFIGLLNIGLKSSKAKIIGEVTEVKRGPTGHVYFSIKDEKDQSVLSCIMWRTRFMMYGIELKEGLKIIAYGYPEIYKLSGRLSFISETIEPAGEGALKKEYDRLRKKLESEGLFEKARKRNIPNYCHKVGVITSLGGAVILDFSNNLAKFGFDVKLIDSRVEGQGAVEDLLAAIRTFRKKDMEALVVIRGGGSLESMQAFNNEALVREIAKFPAPVIAGIGHHKDEPLAALVADASVSTPTAAAHLLGESWERAQLILERHERQILNSYQNVLENTKLFMGRSIVKIFESGGAIIVKYREAENRIKIALANFKNALANIKKGINASLEKSISGFKKILNSASQELERAERIVNINNPERQLKLGYSIAMIGERIIRSVKEAEVGKDINLRISDGDIISKITKIIEGK